MIIMDRIVLKKVSKKIDRILLEYNFQDSSEQIKKEIIQMIETIHKKNLIKSRSYVEFIIVTTYIVLRKRNIIVTFDELSEILQTKIKNIYKTYQLTLSELGIKFDNSSIKEPEIDFFCSKFNLDSNKSELVKLILKSYTEKQSNLGKSNIALIGAAIYLVINEFGNNNNNSISQIAIANKINKSEVTIRKRIKEIRNFLLQNNIIKVSR